MAPGKSIQSDEDLLAYIRKTAVTVYHPVGTCKMGVDDMSVVSPDNLKVKGMRNLRVIDASIMPSIISGNTSANSNNFNCIKHSFTSNCIAKKGFS